MKSVNVDDCNFGACQFKACRVNLAELETGGAVGLDTARVALRVDSCFFCCHCGRTREVWGTYEGVQAHHKRQHPAVPLNAMPISVEDGCDRIAVAIEVGQAAWYRG